MELRPYQNDIITSVQSAWRAGFQRPCVVLPCGGGKSVIAAEMAKRATDNRKSVMFLVHRRELCEQIETTFSGYGVDMGRCSVNMVQTLTRRINSHEAPSLIITDENHHCTATSYRKIYQAFPNTYCIGLTATPVRLNGGGLGEINDKLIIGPTVKELIAMKNLAPYDYYAPAVADLSKLKSKCGDYSPEDIEAALSKPCIYGDVIKYYKQLSYDRQAICYCATISHSVAMCEAFRKAGISAYHLDGETPQNERRAIIKGFRNGDIKILCNVDLISEGFDVPDCNTAILLRPTKSLTLFIQQSMRCMRYKEGKRAVIIDHVGNVHRHGLPDTDREWSLDPKPPTQKSATTTVKVKQCTNCFFTHEPAPICPNCGFVYPKTEKELKEQHEAELIQITAGFETPTECKNIEQLYAFAKNKGYKPGYAYIMARERGWLR